VGVVGVVGLRSCNCCSCLSGEAELAASGGSSMLHEAARTGLAGLAVSVKSSAGLTWLIGEGIRSLVMLIRGAEAPVVCSSPALLRMLWSW